MDRFNLPGSSYSKEQLIHYTIKIEKMKSTLLFLMLGLSLLVGSAFTVQAKWVVIGQKEASYGKDRDILKVRGNDVFKAIKIKVVDSGLDMTDFDIVFENGERMNVAIQKNFHQGEESRVIDLPGNRRRIDRLEFLYDTKGILRGKANVIVFGKK
ncbi:MAG: hypothetical protein IPL23_11915 [Saprospiraceae bacterium]|nr:hypothetical protein [Saprospiraceae bacterium]MBK8633154.1 hypothetical protein [Saprospiraceae bacterium]MBP7642341.1 hypothetical protein [Saprospiraceae bacterium]HMS67413.1 hypothetical protein [Saprospiraceae bacterium]